jgi:hypothetical protein
MYTKLWNWSHDRHIIIEEQRRRQGKLLVVEVTKGLGLREIFDGKSD